VDEFQTMTSKCNSRALILRQPAQCITSYICGCYITGTFICSFCTFSGKNPADDYLEGMMNEAPGPINFTMFLTLFGERLQGTDPEDVIKNAFGCFDEENKGVINEERLRELLTSMGDRFTDEEV
jgi:Ca2+-binding EF-hand superfamily protein